MSKLSIIIPMLGPSRYLRECLLSLVDQDYRNMEVLIVRDFEDELTVNEIDMLIKEFASQITIKQIATEESFSGLSSARNTGIRNSKSDYVMFMEPEDMLGPDTVRQLIDAGPNLPVPIIYTKVSPYHRFASGYHEEAEEVVTLLNETDDDKLKNRPVIDLMLAKFDDPVAAYMVADRDYLEDFTVLGCMFSRGFLRENDIYFETDVKIYPDAPFIAKALLYSGQTAKVSEGNYIRRCGTFRYPLEKLSKPQLRLEDYMRCYDNAYTAVSGKSSDNIAMISMLQYAMCNFYVNKAIKYIYRHKDTEFAVVLYDTFKRQIIEVRKNVLRNYDAAERKHLKLLLKGDINQSVSYMKKYVKKAVRKNTFSDRKKIVREIANLIFGNMDILDRYMIFESGNGDSYSGDPKYIYKFLQKEYPGEYRCIWVANDKELSSQIDGDRIVVKKNTIRYYYYILRSKYWIKDGRQPIKWNKSKEQVFISTWLGTPVQKMHMDQPGYATLPPQVNKGLKAQVKQWDAVICGNEYTKEVYKSSLGVEPSKILNIGHPKNDYLVAADAEEEKARLKEVMGLPKDKKVILYAPVFREFEDVDVSGMYVNQLGLYRIKEQLGDEYVVLLRFNPLMLDKITVADEALRGFAYDCSTYNDIQELLLVSDYLITDYSSVAIDYSVLGRPIFFYFYDFDNYKRDKEHFYFNFESDDLPGPKCSSTQEIIDYIKDGNDDYKDKREMFRQAFVPRAKGSAKRLAMAMFEEMQDIFQYEKVEGERN